MPDLTQNIGLKKPQNNETADIEVINKNMDIIDGEIAKKVSSTQDGRMSKEDKQKLDAIQENATNYQHPATHSASIITQDSNHRFVTDEQIGNWDTQMSSLASTEVEKGASEVGIHDADGHFKSNNVERALSELFTNVSNGKIHIASAIADMRQSASGSDNFATLASHIRDISNDATASSSYVLSGKTFYAGGVKRTGTMPNRGRSVTITPGTTTQTKYAGYYSGNITIEGDSDLIPRNIREGKSIFGVRGTLSEGRKVAIGTSTTYGSTSQYLEVNNLTFRPKYVMWFSVSSTYTTDYFGIICDTRELFYEEEKYYGFYQKFKKSSPSIMLNNPITDNGFIFYNTDAYGPNNSFTFKWIAVGY